MKYNLKNRPKIKNPPKDEETNRNRKWLECYDEYHADSMQWFEGFEKELREMLPKEGQSYDLADLLIKEILGE